MAYVVLAFPVLLLWSHFVIGGETDRGSREVGRKFLNYIFISYIVASIYLLVAAGAEMFRERRKKVIFADVVFAVLALFLAWVLFPSPIK